MYLDTSIKAPNSPPVVELAALFKALSEPARLSIVLALSDECRPVSDVAAATGLPQPLVSHHLRILRDAGVARPDRRGAYVYY
jgi:DNA-binding transcriptional ArsR family regulator